MMNSLTFMWNRQKTKQEKLIDGKNRLVVARGRELEAEKWVMVVKRCEFPVIKKVSPWHVM